MDMNFWNWITGRSNTPAISHNNRQTGKHSQQVAQVPVRDSRLGPEDVQILITEETTRKSWPRLTFMAVTPQGITYSSKENGFESKNYRQIISVDIADDGIMIIELTTSNHLFIEKLQDMHKVAEMIIAGRERYIGLLTSN